MSVRRYDRSALGKPKTLDNGWLRADAWIARTGLLEYHRADGSKFIEYRPADEHTPEALATFDAVPLTNDHPPSGLLTAENTKMYQVGTVLSPTVDGDRVRAGILITDAATIKAIKGGKAELSCGYMCDLDETPGTTPDGQHYDAVQRNVRGNHVAVVGAGRAGPEIRLRIDSLDAEVIPFTPSKETEMHKLVLDGIEFEVAKPAFDAINKALTAAAVEKAELQKAVDSEKARADVASGEVAKLKAELTEAPAKVRTQIAERVALEGKAREVLGAESKFDGKSDLEIKTMVAATSGVKLDGKAEAYVDAAFEIVMSKVGEKKAAAQLQTDTAPVHTDGTKPGESVVEKAKREYAERSRNLHRAHLEKK